jgi:hypothetical protein
MALWQFALVAVTLGLMLLLFITFLNRFKVSKAFFIPIFFILILFCSGFCLRLSKTQSLIDGGFFLTEFSYLCATLVFSSALILGQMKYWGVVRSK